MRYIDDFIILGKTNSLVSKAFNKAKIILKEMGMDAYSPSDGSGKAKQDKSTKGLNYLGCFMNDSFVHPSVKSRNEIKKRIRQLLSIRCNQLKDIGSNSWSKDFSFIRTLQDVNNILMGWGNQYAFCNSKDLFREIDKEINKYLNEYFHNYNLIHDKLSKKNTEAFRKLLGVHLLKDSYCNPILPLSR